MTGGTPTSADGSRAPAGGPVGRVGANADTAAVLTTQLRALRAQRLADEREGEHLPALLRAIALTRRDRDSGASQQLRAHRAHLERIWADAEDLIVTGMRVALRVHLRGGGDTDPVVRRARQVIEQSQKALLELSEAVKETT
jgi:hypothetical protein